MIIPGYRDLVLVANGGFASVYRAHQDTFDRTVAVKVLHAELHDERDRRRFARECSTMGRLTGHPHIVTILDSGFTDAGQAYLTTPFYTQGSLDTRLLASGPLPVAEVLDIGVALAGALERAHRSGILHRDLKPANVLMSDYGEPALTDFGIASITTGDATLTATHAFTISHAPPEVLEGAGATVLSDVYSLGSTLWTLLTGRPPFSVEGEDGLIQRALRVQQQPLPPTGRDDVPDVLEATLARAMAKAPDERYPTAAALGLALQAVQHRLGQPETPLRVGKADPDEVTVPPGSDDAEATATGARTTPSPALALWGDEHDGVTAPTEATEVAGPPPPPLPPSPPPATAPPATAPTERVTVAAPPPRRVADDSRAREPRWARRAALVTAALLVVALLAAVWVAARGSGDGSDPSDQAATSVAPPTSAPTSTTVAPGSPTSSLPTTSGTDDPASPSTSAAPGTSTPPSGAGSARIPDDAPEAVRSAAGTAQEAANALAAADWDRARELVDGLSGSDVQLERSWDRLDGVTQVVTDWTDGDQVVLRLGQVAHERNIDGSRRTNLYCVTWTVAGGRVVAMVDQQDVGTSPWRDGEWVDPDEVVPTLRAECRPL